MPQKSATEKLLCHINDRVNSRDEHEILENVCVKESDYPLTKHANGNHYCLFHLPSKEKTAKFEEIFHERLNSVKEKIACIRELPEEKCEQAKNEISYDFRYVRFPSGIILTEYKFEVRVDFSEATFLGKIDFSEATFLDKVDFRNATFLGEIDFSKATFFGKVNFYHTRFSSGAFFGRTKFSGNTFFSGTKFLGYTNFRLAEFKEASEILFYNIEFTSICDFDSAIFAGYVSFREVDTDSFIKESQHSALSLQNVRLEKNDRLSFHTIKLYPNWFVNIDSRKIIFTDVRWGNLDSKFLNKNIKSELENTRRVGVHAPHRLFEITCRQLAVNAEENNRYDDASGFRKMASESKRLADYKGFKIWSLHWWYWLSSFYGESWQRAIVVLFIILFGFALIYTQTDYQTCPNNQPLAMSITECKTEPEKCKCQNGGLNIKEAFTNSISIALFQNVEFRKTLTIWGELATYLEKILAPLQAALLALAIRRKFMR